MSPLTRARHLLARAQRVAILTGAGISAESGIPTFRGPNGLWRDYRPEDLATPEAFARDPQLVWEWYMWRRALIAAAEPNAGHLALVAIEQRVTTCTLITQNVDGLHDRAGSTHIHKIHGDIWLTRCQECGYQRHDRTVVFTEVPLCPDCGARLRPGVVWFGEPLPRLVWEDAQRAVADCQVLLIAGTSAQVFPAAGLIGLASDAGAATVEINREDTFHSVGVTVSLRGLCGDLLPKLV